MSRQWIQLLLSEKKMYLNFFYSHTESPSHFFLFFLDFFSFRLGFRTAFMDCFECLKRDTELCEQKFFVRTFLRGILA